MGFAKRISDIMICSTTKHYRSNVAFASDCRQCNLL